LNLRYSLAIVWLGLATASNAELTGPNATNVAWRSFTNWTETSTEAARALVSFRRLVTPKNFAKLGLHSTSEIGTTSLGEPLAVYHIGLDSLRDFQKDRSPANLLTNLTEVIYPITVNQEVRSSLALARVKGRWTERRFGASNLIRLLANARKERAEATGLPLSSLFAVQVPAFNVYLIGYFSADRLMLVSVVDDAYLQLRAHEPRPGGELLAGLVPFAQKRNRLPA